MKKVKLKYSIYEFNETVCEVDLHLSHQYKPDKVKRTVSKPGAAPSEAQLKRRERFKRAEAYAREALSIPLLRARYEELGEIEGKSPEGAAMADFLRGNGRSLEKTARQVSH